MDMNINTTTAHSVSSKNIRRSPSIRNNFLIILFYVPTFIDPVLAE